MEEKIKIINTKLTTLNNTLQDLIKNTSHTIIIHPSIELNTIRQKTWTSILEHTSRSLHYILLEQINADITDTTHTLETIKQELHAHTTKLQLQQKRIHTASKYTSTSASPPKNTSTSASPSKTSSPSNNVQYRDIRLNQSHTSHITLSPSTTTIFIIIFLQIIIFLTHIIIPTLITQIRTDHLYYPHVTMMHHAKRLHKNTKHTHIQTPCFKEQFLRTFLAGNTEKHK